MADARHNPCTAQHCSVYYITFHICFCKRNMQKPERLQYGFLTERDEGPAMFRYRDFRMDRNLMEDTVPFSRAHRQDCLPSLDRSCGENTIPEETTPGTSAAPVHYKVLEHAT